jgi:hypothetical protein
MVGHGAPMDFLEMLAKKRERKKINFGIDDSICLYSSAARSTISSAQ